MPSTLVQFRVDESCKNESINICNLLGIDLQTYLRMCMSRLIQEQGIPFSMKIENQGLQVLHLAQKISKENGNSQLTLDEINAEIDQYRKGR